MKLGANSRMKSSASGMFICEIEARMFSCAVRNSRLP